ncbi:MAG: hypothetical protein ABIG10_04220 [bacterium]
MKHKEWYLFYEDDGILKARELIAVKESDALVEGHRELNKILNKALVYAPGLLENPFIAQITTPIRLVR